MERVQALDAVSAAVNRQDWLDDFGTALQHSAETLFGAAGPAEQTVRNWLHGTPLGHPLHPIVVSVPIGAWTCTAVFDALDALAGQDALRPAADATLALGLLVALKAAAAGLADWSATDGAARRVGVAHALLNGAATLLYSGSLLARWRGARSAGRTLAVAGFATVGASGYLGGELVYHHRIGVDHADDQDLAADWVAVLPTTELAEDQPRRVEAAGAPVVLVRERGIIHALGETCSHLGGPLSEGKVADGCLSCPWHGSRFALDDGHAVDGPATYPVPVYEVRVRNGQIEVRPEQR